MPPRSLLSRQSRRIELNQVPKGIIILILFVLSGCETGEWTSTSTLRCSTPASSGSASAILGNIGDQPIYQGRLYVVEGSLQFRPCDQREIYLVVADLPIEDALHEDTATHDTAADAPIYVRFNGHELNCKGELPDRYAGLVKVTRVQVSDAAIPSSCR